MTTENTSPSRTFWFARMYEAYDVDSTAALETALTAAIDTLQGEIEVLQAALPALLATLQTARENWAAQSIAISVLQAAEAAVSANTASTSQKQGAMQLLISHRSVCNGANPVN